MITIDKRIPNPKTIKMFLPEGTYFAFETTPESEFETKHHICCGAKTEAPLNIEVPFEIFEAVSKVVEKRLAEDYKQWDITMSEATYNWLASENHRSELVCKVLDNH